MSDQTIYNLTSSKYGRWVSETRQAKGYSQAKLAEAAGVSRLTIRNVELGKTRPQKKTSAGIAQVLGRSQTLLPPLQVPLSDVLHKVALIHGFTYEEVLRLTMAKLKDRAFRTLDDWTTLLQALRAYPQIFDI